MTFRDPCAGRSYLIADARQPSRLFEHLMEHAGAEITLTTCLLGR
ncbi:hypothetical protein [Arthrobacter sp. I3]|nr:hypothetical protein [Arthrobacter sp. I3]